MMNKLSSCVNYHTLEEIETELTYNASKNSNYTPYGMHLCPESDIGLAWDNFDLYVETENGKDTLQNTNGMCYQVLENLKNEITVSQLAEYEESDNMNEENITNKKPRKTYELTPYKKNVKNE